MGTPAVNQHDGLPELTYELRAPKSVMTAYGAPPRLNVQRLVAYSAFTSWSDISRLMWPLYDKAQALAPEPPVRLEARKIASAASDPAKRAEAALRLVQEQIRYV
jgi:hypothetical protein